MAQEADSFFKRKLKDQKADERTQGRYVYLVDLFKQILKSAENLKLLNEFHPKALHLQHEIINASSAPSLPNWR